MISNINKAIINIVPYLPISFIRVFSNKYIAGTSLESALKVIKKINNNNMSATIDILGEHTKTINEANKITNDYIDIYKGINSNNLDCNISLKPSHIGSDISNNCYKKNLDRIHSQAIDNNNFLRLDMENTILTDLTIESFLKQYKYQTNIGIAIQAYLYRSMKDLKKLTKNMNIRLCKGIYNESQKIAIKDPNKINENYIKLLKESFKKNLYIGIATHDVKLINTIIEIIKEKKIDNNKFEFQILYGVPMGNTLKRLINNNFKVRVYIPFGDNWYDYSIRRLTENPNIVGYIIKNLFKKNFYK